MIVQKLLWNDHWDNLLGESKVIFIQRAINKLQSLAKAVNSTFLPFSLSYIPWTNQKPIYLHIRTTLKPFTTRYIAARLCWELHLYRIARKEKGKGKKNQILVFESLLDTVSQCYTNLKPMKIRSVDTRQDNWELSIWHQLGIQHRHSEKV